MTYYLKVAYSVYYGKTCRCMTNSANTCKGNNNKHTKEVTV